MREELKPCPFCGGPGYAFGFPEGKLVANALPPRAIGCPDCQLLVGDVKGEDGNCVPRWNRRASPTPPPTTAREAAERIIAWVDISGDGPADAWPTTCGDAVTVARALLSSPRVEDGRAWQPLNPDVDVAYYAVRNSTDPEIMGLQRRMSFGEIHTLVGFVARALIASCPPPSLSPPDGEQKQARPSGSAPISTGNEGHD